MITQIHIVQQHDANLMSYCGISLSSIGLDGHIVNHLDTPSVPAITDQEAITSGSILNLGAFSENQNIQHLVVFV